MLKGTAPEDLAPQIKKFRKIKMEKITPGNKKAVYSKKLRDFFKKKLKLTPIVFFFQLVPFNILKLRVEVYPAKALIFKNKGK